MPKVIDGDIVINLGINETKFKDVMTKEIKEKTIWEGSEKNLLKMFSSYPDFIDPTAWCIKSCTFKQQLKDISKTSAKTGRVMYVDYNDANVGFNPILKFQWINITK